MCIRTRLFSFFPVIVRFDTFSKEIKNFFHTNILNREEAPVRDNISGILARDPDTSLFLFTQFMVTEMIITRFFKLQVTLFLDTIANNNLL